MAVLDEQTALARIITRGWQLAQSQELSVSPVGPDPLGLSLHVPQQLWGAAAAMTYSSPMPSGICDMVFPEMNSSSAELTAPALSVAGSATSSHMQPAAMNSMVSNMTLEARSPSWEASNPSPATRCLCATLSRSPQPAKQPAACPGAPRARQAARLLMPLATSAAAGNSSLCPHHSPEGRSRLQQWLSQMELKLAVPPSPVMPAVDVPAAPKVGGVPAVCMPALLAASTGPASSPDMSQSSSISSLDASVTAQPAGALAGQLCRTPCDRASSKKRTLPDLDALSFNRPLDGAAHRPTGGCAAGSQSSATAGSLQAVRSSKRRSLDGAVVLGGVGAQAGDVPPVPGGPVASVDAPAVSLAVGDMPAPAFVILGLLSDPQQQV